MTNYEKLIRMSKEELAAFIIECEVDVFSTFYCKSCEHHKDKYGCDIPENEDLPCENVTDVECAIKWLDSEA